jgi:hypothetical protein
LEPHVVSDLLEGSEAKKSGNGVHNRNQSPQRHARGNPYHSLFHDSTIRYSMWELGLKEIHRTEAHVPNKQIQPVILPEVGHEFVNYGFPI